MYRIVTDSSWDLNDMAEKLEVEIVPFQVNLDGNGYKKEYFELKAEEIYQYMVDHPTVYPKTAQPAMDDYYKAFEKIAKEGNDIICFTLSSKLTGSINSALNVKAMILDEYPDIQIEVIDSTQATVTQGLIVKEIAEYRQKGATYQQAIEKAKEIIKTARIFFSVNSLDYLIQGGRIGKVTGNFANSLNLKPMIVLNDGELHSLGIARGRKPSMIRAVKELVSFMKENELNIHDYHFIVGYGFFKEEGEFIHSRLIKGLKEIDESFDEEIPMVHIGSTIGIYTGPTPIGVGFVKKIIPEL